MSLSIFEAAAALRKHISEKTANMNLVSATWDYAVDPKTGQILKLSGKSELPGAWTFHVIYRDGNIEIEEK